MGKWQRANFQPVLPIGKNGVRITGSKEHIELSHRAAAEGMVLLKNNNNTLPLNRGAKVALLGKATIEYIKGGGGSGDVYTEYIHNIADGMASKAAEGKVAVFSELVDFYKDYVYGQYDKGYTPGMIAEPQVPSELLARAKAYADVAIVSFSRYSGEGWDRTIGENDDIRTEYTLWPGEKEQRDLYNEAFNPNDFYLTKGEREVLEAATKNFKTVIVVLNVGGIIDTNWTLEKEVSAVLVSWQGGMEGGLATADVLCGDINPSGHLTDTFAKELTDYPSTQGFHDSADYVTYNEDIYVGYRYFYTIPGAADKVNYPFGFGLSYTDFAIETVNGCEKDGVISFEVKVTNEGNVPGKEVVQLYYGAPQGKLKKASKELIRFAKTRTINPGESEKIILNFKVNEMKSYDDSGKVCDAAWVMEKGTYQFYIGDNVRDAVLAEFKYNLSEDTVIEKLNHKLVPQKQIERLLSDGTTEKAPVVEKRTEQCKLVRQSVYELEGRVPQVKAVKGLSLIKRPEAKPQLIDVVEGVVSLEDFIDALSVEERIDLLGGQVSTGVAITCGIGNNKTYGIPNVMTADGPAGLRIPQNIGVTTTAWPIATSLACTWDIPLIESVGREAALEVKENNLSIWLAPACNIHRSPLCGRNFEYFSEDPYLTGMAAIAIVEGCQSEKIGATPKHFVANNKETNRKASDSVVSERALREIYLKQFEMVVKIAKPYMMMSSYNKVNGSWSSESKELLTDILRGEWGYEGVVTSDWWTLAEHYVEIKAGNDLKMACGYTDRVLEAYEAGYISESEINASVKRVLELILKIE